MDEVNLAEWARDPCDTPDEHDDAAYGDNGDHLYYDDM